MSFELIESRSGPSFLMPAVAINSGADSWRSHFPSSSRQGNSLVSRLLNDDCELANACDVVRRDETQVDSLTCNEVSFRPVADIRLFCGQVKALWKAQIAGSHNNVFACFLVPPSIRSDFLLSIGHQSFSTLQLRARLFADLLPSLGLQYSSINLAIETKER